MLLGFVIRAKISFLTPKKSCTTCPNWGEGGVNPSGQPDRFFPVFFFDHFPNWDIRSALRITKQSNNDYDNDGSDNCDNNFGTFDYFGVKMTKKYHIT